jgi:hypothetical protein
MLTWCPEIEIECRPLAAARLPSDYNSSENICQCLVDPFRFRCLKVVQHSIDGEAWCRASVGTALAYYGGKQAYCMARSTEQPMETEVGRGERRPSLYSSNLGGIKMAASMEVNLLYDKHVSGIPTVWWRLTETCQSWVAIKGVDGEWGVRNRSGRIGMVTGLCKLM